jgi:peptide-methionine (S)-S-oxide reductase
MQVTFDPKETSFENLLNAFADQIDLTTLNRQGSDRGTQYRSGVYFHSEAQKEAIEKFYAQLNKEIQDRKRSWAGQGVVAEVEPIKEYYIAESYHQQYLSKGGRFGTGQSAAKGCNDKIRCYG